jgi:hypothetical protein
VTKIDLNANPPPADDKTGPPTEGLYAIDGRALLAELRALAAENGRLRAERDAIAAERDRLITWIDTDRELTARIVSALETDLLALRAEIEHQRLKPVVAVDETSREVQTPGSDPKPNRQVGLGRRFRDRFPDPST